MRSLCVAVSRLWRHAPMFLRQRPRTPLRVLAVVAIDTLHVVRTARPLTRQQIDALALLLDFEGWTNAAWDHKKLCAAQYGAARAQLHEAGLGSLVQAYLDRLQRLESRRPSVGGDPRRFAAARVYREEVARVSLATLTAAAQNAASIDEAIRATHVDANVNSLFRLAMQCQIIDDVIDHRADVKAGLPSFLTACDSVAEGIGLTAEAARDYAGGGTNERNQPLLPFRLALSIVSFGARGLVRLAVLRKGSSTTYPGQTRTAYRR